MRVSSGEIKKSKLGSKGNLPDLGNGSRLFAFAFFLSLFSFAFFLRFFPSLFSFAYAFSLGAAPPRGLHRTLTNPRSQTSLLRSKTFLYKGSNMIEFEMEHFNDSLDKS